MTSFVMAGGSSNSAQRPAFSLTLTDLCCLQHSEAKKTDSLSKNTSFVKRSCQTLRQEGTSIRRYKSKPLILDVTFLLIWHFSPKGAKTKREKTETGRMETETRGKWVRRTYQFYTFNTFLNVCFTHISHNVCVCEM